MINPKRTAAAIKSTLVIATEPFAGTTAPAASKPLKVFATTSAKAATTKIENNQVKAKKSFLPTLPIYFSII